MNASIMISEIQKYRPALNALRRRYATDRVIRTRTTTVLALLESYDQGDRRPELCKELMLQLGELERIVAARRCISQA